MNKVNIILIAFVILFSASCSENSDNKNEAEYISNGIGDGGTIGSGDGGGDL